MERELIIRALMRHEKATWMIKARLYTEVSMGYIIKTFLKGLRDEDDWLHLSITNVLPVM